MDFTGKLNQVGRCHIGFKLGTKLAARLSSGKRLLCVQTILFTLCLREIKPLSHDIFYLIMSF